MGGNPLNSLKEYMSLDYDDLIISVNTSVIQFTQEKFAQEVMQLLDKYDLSLKCLSWKLRNNYMDNVETVMNNLATVERLESLPWMTSEQDTHR